MQHDAREKRMRTKHVPGACDVRTATLCTSFLRTTVRHGGAINWQSVSNAVARSRLTVCFLL